MAAVEETNAPPTSATPNAAQLPSNGPRIVYVDLIPGPDQRPDHSLESNEEPGSADVSAETSRHQAAERAAREHERRMRPKRIPFHTDEPMSGPARYSWADLRKPLLRKCPFELKDIPWLEHLAGGYDGYCWKVAFGDQGPFVVKLFWDDEPPENMYYWAAQREFQKAAVLQMIEASLGDLGDGDGQIVGKYRRGPTDPAQEYFAIVYEYIEAEQGDDDPDSVDLEEIQASMEFLWTLGFEFYDTTILGNWKRGVLIDLSDIIFPLGYGRHRRRHYPGNAKSLQKQGEVIGNPRRLRRC
ncbi:hypothetical protein RB595_010750 [Gaeumannomyces hyphopodioides]